MSSAPVEPRVRVRKTRRGVVIADRVSRLLISVSGIAIILAILLVFVFLASVAYPLFIRASIQGEDEVVLPSPSAVNPPGGRDPKRLLSWSLLADGTLVVKRIGDDRILEKRKVFPDGPAVTAQSHPLQRTDSRNEPYWDVAFGFADGSTSRATLRFNTDVQEKDKLTKELRELDIGRALPMDSGVLLRDGLDVYVLLTVKLETQPRTPGTSTEKVVRVAQAFGEKGPTTALLTSDGKLTLVAVEEKLNRFTGEIKKTARAFALPSETPRGRTRPGDLRLSHDGTQVYLLWSDGFHQRLDAKSPDRTTVAAEGYALGKDRSGTARLRHVTAATDEDQRLAWTMTPEGTLIVFRLDTGEELERRPLFDAGPPLVASSQPVDRAEQVDGKKENYLEISFAFLDGSYRLGRLRIKSSFLDPAVLTDDVLKLKEGRTARLGGGLVVRTPYGQYRLDEVQVDLLPVAPAASPEPIRLIDHAVTRFESYVCLMTESGVLRREEVKRKERMDTKVVTMERLGAVELPYQRSDRGAPDYLLMSAMGDGLYLVWNDGTYQRLNVRFGRKPEVVETGDLLGHAGHRLTSLRQMLGRQTILTGDSAGRLRAWFSAPSKREATKDGFVTVMGHEFAGNGSAVTTIAGSSRSRLIAVGHDDGGVRVVQTTSEKKLAELSLGGRTVDLLAIAPKEDGVLALGEGEGKLWKLTPGHPEISPSSLFLKVWYEGSEEPRLQWESSSGDDAFEPKFSLTPLVFGTLKASFYSLLFGVPLALLAAVYTSEFMHPRTKTIVKPAVEMMAGLPSVVLGFLAGLVFAQFIENVVPAVLCSFVCVPFCFLVGARIIQVLPEKLGRVLGRRRFLFFLPSLVTGLVLAYLLGPVVERVVFGGNIMHWLSDTSAGMIGGWCLLFLPISIVATIFLMARWITPELRRISSNWRRSSVGWLDFARFFLGCFIAITLALAFSFLMESIGSDPRGKFIGTYSQRNALVVGFVMGFAIIPIIYTIADDALSSVPEHLRSGSLATGATPWQTATRIVIPTAMSGLFSAVMIGMGRAIGETMIVVMATGNTAVMEWNVFSGFRTLSANLAVELPEAAEDSTHYRTLFLSALVLFSMTFVLNTVAEIVRLRFRRRAYSL